MIKRLEYAQEVYEEAQSAPMQTEIFLQLVTVDLLQRIASELHSISHKGSKIMAAIDDLKAAILAQTAEIQNGNATDARLLADIDQAVQKILSGGTADPDVAAAATAIGEATATLHANNQANADAAAKIEAALGPVAPATAAKSAGKKAAKKR